MNYRSVADLNKTIVDHLSKIPEDVDLIVGIPRSGLLAANLLALHLNLPLTDLEGFLEGRLLQQGGRLEASRDCSMLQHIKKVLVVDDSVASGRQMLAARERLAKASLPYEIMYGAIYVFPAARSKVDLFLEVVAAPRVFEWNLMRHNFLETGCVDIDGVLCRNPTEEENDDGPRYENFLKGMEPLVVPTTQIGWLVTCRLEKYRELTEQWLATHKIRYKELIMMNFPDKAARLAYGSPGRFKGQVYRSVGAEIFIESCPDQAREIAQQAGKAVICMSSRAILYPTALARVPALARKAPKSIVRRLRTIAGKVGQHLFREQSNPN
ncbi:MAG: orotate phosphoribosyltransferase [Acidobacteria bacterium]|nr:orotate phosphoribosyltransferase [Acidobacteriota bacterium]